MNQFSIKVVPYSAAERFLIDAMTASGVKFNGVICRLGDIWGKPYNEYIFTDAAYDAIRSHLNKEEEKCFLKTTFVLLSVISMLSCIKMCLR